MVYLVAMGEISGSDTTPKGTAPVLQIPGPEAGFRGEVGVPVQDEAGPTSETERARRSAVGTESEAVTAVTVPAVLPSSVVAPSTPAQREAFVLQFVEPKLETIRSQCYLDLRDKYLASIRSDLDAASRAEAQRLVHELVDREYEFRIEANRCPADQVRSAPDLSSGAIDSGKGESGVIEVGVSPDDLWGRGAKTARVAYSLPYAVYPGLEKAKDAVRRARAACQVFF